MLIHPNGRLSTWTRLYQSRRYLQRGSSRFSFRSHHSALDEQLYPSVPSSLVPSLVHEEERLPITAKHLQYFTEASLSILSRVRYPRNWFETPSQRGGIKWNARWKAKGKGKGRWEIMNEKEMAEERKEREKGEKYNEEREEKKKETKKKSGEPAARNELEVNQTYRSYCYHHHLPNYYLHQDSISGLSLPRLSYSMHRIVCQNSEITYVLYLLSHVGVSPLSRLEIRFLSGSKKRSARRVASSTASFNLFFEARVPIFVFRELGIAFWY